MNYDRKLGRWLACILFGFSLSHWGAASAQLAAASTASTATSGRTEEQRQLSELGAGDQISIQVYGQPDMTTTVYVADSGTVSVPLVGAVPVGGLSPVDAARAIEKALKDGQYLVDPHVTIAILQGHSQRVSVIGEVKAPGRYPIDPSTTILDVIAEAGGLTENSADVVYIQRTETDGTSHRYPVALNETSRGQNVTAEKLKGGDSLVVPRAEQYYIYGEVNRPEMYRIEPGMTVVQAISRAGGITPRGSERRVDIKRSTGDGKSTVLHAKLDDPVQPDDVIHVKESIF